MNDLDESDAVILISGHEDPEKKFRALIEGLRDERYKIYMPNARSASEARKIRELFTSYSEATAFAIIDLDHPATDMDFIELIRLIRAAEVKSTTANHWALPILALSRDSNLETQAIDAGATKFMPIENDVYARILSVALSFNDGPDAPPIRTVISDPFDLE